MCTCRPSGGVLSHHLAGGEAPPVSRGPERTFRRDGCQYGVLHHRVRRDRQALQRSRQGDDGASMYPRQHCYDHVYTIHDSLPTRRFLEALWPSCRNLELNEESLHMLVGSFLPEQEPTLRLSIVHHLLHTGIS